MLDREKDGIYTTKYKGATIGALTRQQVIAAVECYECSAPRGTACSGKDMRGDKSHQVRRKEAMKLYGLVPPQAVLSSASKIDGWYKKFREYAKDPEAWWKEHQHSRPRKRSRRKPALTGITVRYECPICGGDHSRADHPAKPTLRELVERRRKERAA